MARSILVRYGRSAYVGRFASDQSFERGTRVVIDSPRGRELGDVLCDGPSDDCDGRVVRSATIEDEPDREFSRSILEAASKSLERDGAIVLDCELLLDRSTALLHVVAWEPVVLDEKLEALSATFGLPVRLLDIARTPVAADPTKCDKPNCGSGGCSSCGTGGGCGTGCSRGTATGDELTARFVELREAMERDAVTGRRELV